MLCSLCWVWNIFRKFDLSTQKENTAEYISSRRQGLRIKEAKAAKTKPVSTLAAVWSGCYNRRHSASHFESQILRSPSPVVSIDDGSGPGVPEVGTFQGHQTILPGWRWPTWWRRAWWGRMFLWRRETAVRRRRTVVWRRMTPLKTHATQPAVFLRRYLDESQYRGFEAFEPWRSGADGLWRWEPFKLIYSWLFKNLRLSTWSSTPPGEGLPLLKTLKIFPQNEFPSQNMLIYAHFTPKYHNRSIYALLLSNPPEWQNWENQYW